MSSKLSCETGVGWSWFADFLKEASPNYNDDFERQNCSMTELAVNRWSELKLYYCNRIVIWKTQAYLLLPVCKTSKSVVVWIPLLQVHKNIISHKNYDIIKSTQIRRKIVLSLYLLIVLCSTDLFQTLTYLAGMCHFIRSSVISYRRMKSDHWTEIISNNKSSETKSQGGRHLGQ